MEYRLDEDAVCELVEEFIKARFGVIVESIEFVNDEDDDTFSHVKVACAVPTDPKADKKAIKDITEGERKIDVGQL